MNKDYLKICHSSEISEGRGSKFILDEETEIALFKVDGKIYCVDNVCSHNHIPIIFQGYLDGMYVSCPVHGFKFHLETGKQPGDSGCSIRTFDVIIEDDNIFVKKPGRKIFDFNF
jgi:nitrite reductase/ring-hydroxylating ferredoxin subunit